MTKIAVFLVILCTLCGAFFHMWVSYEPKVLNDNYGTSVVLVNSEIAAGSVIDRKNLRVELIGSRQTAGDPVTSVDFATGLIAKHDLQSNSILRQSDLLPNPNQPPTYFAFPEPLPAEFKPAWYLNLRHGCRLPVSYDRRTRSYSVRTNTVKIAQPSRYYVRETQR